MTRAEQIQARLRNLEQTITSYRENTVTADSEATRMTLHSLEARRLELQAALDSVSDRNDARKGRQQSGSIADRAASAVSRGYSRIFGHARFRVG